MLVTLLGENGVCSAMVVYFVSGPLQAHLREAADERREKNKRRAVRDRRGGLPKNPSGPTAKACF